MIMILKLIAIGALLVLIFLPLVYSIVYTRTHYPEDTEIDPHDPY